MGWLQLSSQASHSLVGNAASVVEWSEAFSESSLTYDSSTAGNISIAHTMSSWGKFPNEGNRNNV
jgi:hypothetical protein